MSNHSFVCKFLNEISIVAILIFYLKLRASDFPQLALIYNCQFSAPLLLKRLKKCLKFNKLMKSANTSIKLYMLTYVLSLFKKVVVAM